MARLGHRIGASTVGEILKYDKAFDAVFQSDDLRVIKSTPQTPRMNAHCEWIIGTDPTKPATSYYPRPSSTLPRHTTSAPADCSAPASPADSLMSTDTLLDQQR